ncbi:glycopeptide antibiotics resistance protein [Oikeobacillus pervagus]|uniref:Glycopeptide antibiotics resistance protein n=1 Tax=Oikeobacillus pervagus TaxID=1325931 RepID=A0AAJ1T0J3_9BACI|nr:VanZ family protein [Oikeobacillus pervagus]MDQ0214496.1 glycopeptide antibiotics resistance protein [Oikeobacillus pervagus]
MRKPYPFVVDRVSCSLLGIFNILMFVPLGIFQPLLFPKFKLFKWLLPVVASATLSIETYQTLTGVRIFELDDLLLGLALFLV